LLVCISALGSTNGMIFTGARIYYAMGNRHRLFRPLAVWNLRYGTPVISLCVQAVVTLGLLVGFGGTAAGSEPREAFRRPVIFMTPPFYVFLLLSRRGVIILRRRDQATALASIACRGFRCPPWWSPAAPSWPTAAWSTSLTTFRSPATNS
jgi:amino acid transporter